MDEGFYITEIMPVKLIQDLNKRITSNTEI